MNTILINQNLSKYLQHKGITKVILNFFGVKIENPDSKELEIFYPYSDGSIKKCRPYSNQKWSIDTQKKDKNIPSIFGYDQLPKMGKLLIIAAGEKDTMSLYSLGFSAICFNSETSTPNEKVLKELKNRFEDLVIFFDSDQTGRKMSYKLSKECGIPYASLEGNSFGKDITDFVSSGGSKSDIERFINKGISKYYRTLTSYPAKLLRKMLFVEEDYIIPKILSTQSLGAIVGGSDTGKSLLALQFGISYTINRDFLGFETLGKKNVLYFSLEDSQETISKRFKKLSKRLTKEELNQVETKLHCRHLKGEIEEEIKKHLSEHPETGLIIIDTFSDLMAGRDLNSAGQVREVLNPLHEICIQHEVCILFLHHLNKTFEKEQNFGKLGIVGSQAFESKMRVIFQMNKKFSSLGKTEICLGIIKGNDIDDNFKKKSSKLKLNLCQESLWYDKSEYQNHIDINQDELENEINWSIIFGKNCSLTTAELKASLREKYQIKDRTAEKWILSDLKDFRVSKGNYKNPTDQSDEADDIFDNFTL